MSLTIEQFDRKRCVFLFLMLRGGRLHHLSLSLNGFIDLFGMIDHEDVAAAEAAFLLHSASIQQLAEFALSVNAGADPSRRLLIGRGTVMDYLSSSTAKKLA